MGAQQLRLAALYDFVDQPALYDRINHIEKIHKDDQEHCCQKYVFIFFDVTPNPFEFSHKHQLSV
jgi:hypothetical protein